LPQDGFTPLHLAARNDHVGAIEALVAAGADLNAKIEVSY
jgi:ankyrin repeat protein